MVNKVYIVWCKLNKSTDKFDLGVFTDKSKADKVMKDHSSDMVKPKTGKVWIQEYRLS